MQKCEVTSLKMAAADGDGDDEIFQLKQPHQDLCVEGAMSREEGLPSSGSGTGMCPLIRLGNWKRELCPCSRAGLSGATGLRLLQKWIPERSGLWARRRPEGVCAVKKAGVSEPEGRAGELRAMEPMSFPASSRGGAEMSRALGFLFLGGSPSPELLLFLLLSGLCCARSLCPEDKFNGWAPSESSSSRTGLQRPWGDRGLWGRGLGDT